MLQQAIRARLMKVNNQKGMTLIELLAVIVIIGVIAAIAVPLILGAIRNSRTAADESTHKVLIDAAKRYIIQHEAEYAGGTGTTTTVPLYNLKADGFIEDVPKLQAGTDAGKTIIGVIFTRASATATADWVPTQGAGGVVVGTLQSSTVTIP
ncbi:prepilin-type N-terminal cleavage/methylation domain-containing protein [Paenibacillus sp. SI8]|uniref:prepilin-type N-terminal cleavage/methylation domain-containing protein n=1 Tax=unclassified Paenibacillus TaxID=185978 RepID=UPI00346550D8